MGLALRRQEASLLTKPRNWVLPPGSAQEAALVAGTTVYEVPHLLDVVAHLQPRGRQTNEATSSWHAIAPAPLQNQLTYPDMADVKGQLLPKRALEIAAAGGHSVLLMGPPGTGKSMLAQRFVGLLPPMSENEALESAAVQSLAGEFRVATWGQRSFRSPHHTASAVALVGGGSPPRPGEVSLAHHGVLFLDELPEFSRMAIEALREPLECGHIQIARATRRCQFPARFQLIAAMNPCPCGHLGSQVQTCRCTPEQVARYHHKLSGPLLDRIDMQVEVPALPSQELLNSPAGESSAAMVARIYPAHERALKRQGFANSALQGTQIDTHCPL
jgi:magnesium chelatase family protein